MYTIYITDNKFYTVIYVIRYIIYTVFAVLPSTYCTLCIVPCYIQYKWMYSMFIYNKFVFILLLHMLTYLYRNS